MTLTRERSLIIFIALSLLLLASGAWVATLVEASPQPGVLAIAITIDLAVGVPLLYYLLLVRRKLMPLFGLVPVFVLTMLAVRFILPSSEREYLRFSEFLIPAIELAVAVFIMFKLRRIIGDIRSARRDCLYFMDALRTGLRKSLGNDFVAALLAAELALLYLAVAGWFARFRAARQDVSVYSYHRKSNFGFLLWPLAALVVIEAGLLHLVIGIWSQTGAWIFTAVNAYTLLWLVGHFHSARLQPVIVDDECVHLRTGIIWHGRISLANIAEIRRPALSDSKAAGYVNVSLTGGPDTVIVLKEADELEGLFARKKEVRTIGISLDNPGAFSEDVSNRLSAQPQLENPKDGAS